MAIVGKKVLSADLFVFMAAWAVLYPAMLLFIHKQRPDVPLLPFACIGAPTAIAAILICLITRIKYSGVKVFEIDLETRVVKIPVWKEGKLVRLEERAFGARETPRALFSLRINKVAVARTVKGVPITASKGDPRGMQFDLEITSNSGDGQRFPILYDASIKKINNRLAELGVSVVHESLSAGTSS